MWIWNSKLIGIKMKNIFLLSSLLLSLNTFADYDETSITAPLKDKDESSLLSTSCRTRDHLRWDVCYNIQSDDSLTMKSFKFSNDGENTIVPKSGFGVGRSFEFMFEDFARSDLGLLIWDMPDEVESHGHLKLMMFFPRVILPSIRYESDSEKDLVIVTLPNKEEVTFNGKTKEVVSGVLTEAPMTQDSDGNGLEPALKYTGSGVVVSAHRLNDYPVGVNADTRKNQKATISKKGYKDCLVSVSDLWYTDANRGGNVLFNPKYAKDADFNTYVKRKCGFTIY
jgi:hypothetical protein